MDLINNNDNFGVEEQALLGLVTLKNPSSRSANLTSVYQNLGQALSSSTLTQRAPLVCKTTDVKNFEFPRDISTTKLVADEPLQCDPMAECRFMWKKSKSKKRNRIYDSVMDQVERDLEEALDDSDIENKSSDRCGSYYHRKHVKLTHPTTTTRCINLHTCKR